MTPRLERFCLVVALAGLLASMVAAHPGRGELMAVLDARIHVDPGDARLYLARGSLWRHQGLWAEALADYETAALLGEHPAVVDLARGELHLASAQPDEAIRFLDRVLAVAPGQLKALRLRGRAHEALGMITAAASDLGAVLETSENPAPELLREAERVFALSGRNLRSTPGRPTTVDTASTAADQVSSAAEAEARVVRGPYLQLGTPTGVTVRWRTDVATDSRVRYGTSTLELGSSVDDPKLVLDHEIVLTGLDPATTYFYSVGTSVASLAGGDADHRFATSPAPGADGPIRIWVLGDSGTANADARAVRDAYEVFAAGRRTDVWLMLGDNAYVNGTDAEYQSAVFDIYPRMLRGSVLWPTLGNHDGASADSATQTGPYFDIFTLPRAGEAGGIGSGTEAYYSFDYGGIHFVCLDSFASDRSPTGPMLSWLVDDLAANRSAWVIAFWHHPPYSKGSHDSDGDVWMSEMRENVLPILESFGVDLVLAGHSHSYERSYLLDGHYGRSDSLAPSMVLDGGDGRQAGDGVYSKPSLGSAPHEGAVYSVAGSSGFISGGSLDHPAMLVSLNQLGSLVIDVQGNRLDARFLSDRATIEDEFTLTKGRRGTSCVDTETVLCLARGRFRVEVEWQDFTGARGAGRVVPQPSDDSGLLWFFSPSNWELLVKVLDGCGVNGRYWFFAAATTNVGFTMSVTDTATGAVQEYSNPLGTSAAAITDTAAFDTCP